MCTNSRCNCQLGTLGSSADKFLEVFSFIFVSLKKAIKCQKWSFIFRDPLFKTIHFFKIYLEKNNKKITVMPYLSLISYDNPE